MRTEYFVVLQAGWSFKFCPTDFRTWAKQQGIKDSDWEFNNVDHGNGILYFKRGEDALAFKMKFLL